MHSRRPFFRPPSAAPLLACLLSFLPAAVSTAGAAAANHAAPLAICTDYHCDRQQQVRLAPAAWSRIAALFSQVQNAAHEREQIRAAIALFEQSIGEQTETWQDKPRNEGDSSEPGQLDCISESKNTTTYLHLLEQGQLLRWHRVLPPATRTRWLVQYHRAAVIEASGGAQFAVDSWFEANGEPPVVQPLKAWLASRPFAHRLDPIQPPAPTPAPSLPSPAP